ncbi:CHAT domain-containing protein [Maribacter arenosus]|uniref:CHAT domain-containing protein n=1 Tax=Maribacter arenosus TaxID=1854708 RepID=A0ABR7VFY1_9FLAO|nr:CHAT domain-containing tetratricopeptide repeat protein [Maribacter arenosus]MBD0852551.1 CHAT domain-containing protein [Maribacter arenosus]
MRRLLIIPILLSFFATLGQQNAYKNKINMLLEKGYTHYGVQKDSGQYYFKKIEQLALDEKDTLTVLDMLITSNRHLGYFYDLNGIRKNLQKIDQIAKEESSFLQNLEDALLYRNSIRADKGNYYFKLGNNNRAKSYFNEIKNSYQNYSPESLTTDHFELLSNSISFLAKIYQLEDKFDLAKDYYLRIITLIKKVTPENLNSLNINYALLAEVLTEQGDYKQANSYLKMTLTDALKLNNNPNRIINVANNLADNYLVLSKKDSARYYLALMEIHLDRSPHFKELFHRTSAKLEYESNNIEGALSEIDSAFDAYLEHTEQTNSETLANIYLERGNILVFAKDFKNALMAADQGLEILPSKFGTTYLELMALKTNSLLNMKKHNEVNTVSLLAVSTLDSLKSDYQYSSDKINLIEKTFPLFESALEANYSLFKKTGKAEHVTKAFFFMEKSKSVLLLEALMAAKADKFAQVPDSLLEKERILRSEITTLKKELLIESNEKEPLRSTIFDLTEQQRNLMESMSKTYPEYYRLRYGRNTTDLDDFKKTLDRDELLISYFYGNEAIYTLVVDKNASRIEKIEIDAAFENKLKSIHRMLSNPKSNVAALGSATYELYARLLEPILTSEDQRKLIIITDGLLNYIPFAALNTSPEDVSYLAEKHAISYVNSATLLSELRQRQPKQHTVLAFAPSFDGTVNVSNADRGKLLPLPNNKKEVAQILTSFNGRSFIDKEASLLNFKSHLSSFGIVHLATHAIFDDRAPEYSYLAFSQSENAMENLLYVADLYNLKVDADLVTLSACESGIGDLKRGEGFMSLARGFFYSGAASIASTLWKINDASTTDLMHGFYKNLSKGDAKDVALQKAQVEFLNVNRQNSFSHPYYWSGFVISGNTAPLSSTYNWSWLLIGVIVLLVGIFFYLKIRKRNT